MRAQRGFSLVEVLVGLLILTIVITTTISMFVERRRHLREANETILAYQALANEAEEWRHFSFAELGTKAQSKNFYSTTTLLNPMKPFTTSFNFVKLNDTRTSITITIKWGDAKTQRTASLDVVRCETGTGSLW